MQPSNYIVLLGLAFLVPLIRGQGLVLTITSSQTCALSSSVLGTSDTVLLVPSGGLCNLGNGLSGATQVNASGSSWVVSTNCNSPSNAFTAMCGPTAVCSANATVAPGACAVIGTQGNYVQLLSVQPKSITTAFYLGTACQNSDSSYIAPTTQASGTCGPYGAGFNNLWEMAAYVGNNSVVYSICGDAACSQTCVNVGIATLGSCTAISSSNVIFNPPSSSSSGFGNAVVPWNAAATLLFTAAAAAVAGAIVA